MYDQSRAKVAFAEAIEHAGGTAAALAQALNVTPQRVSIVRACIGAGKMIPPPWAQKIETLYGISKSVFRPDLWPDD